MILVLTYIGFITKIQWRKQSHYKNNKTKKSFFLLIGSVPFGQQQQMYLYNINFEQVILT